MKWNVLNNFDVPACRDQVRSETIFFQVSAHGHKLVNESFTRRKGTGINDRLSPILDSKIFLLEVKKCNRRTVTSQLQKH